MGYSRVSTDGQSLEAQRVALEEAGAEKIFAEKVSGVVTERKGAGASDLGPWSKRYPSCNTAR